MSEANPEQSDAQDSPQTEVDSPAPAPAETTSTGQRPTTVTAAVVIAFLLSLYELATCFVLFVGANLTAGPTAIWYVFGVVHLVLAGLLAWGGWAALTGSTERILVLTALAAVIVLAIKTVIEIVYGIPPVGWLILVLYGVMGWLLIRPNSKEYFAAPGATAGQ
jgi:cation transport ATPase